MKIELWSGDLDVEADPILYAYDNSCKLYDSEPNVVDRPEALRLSREAHTQQLMTVSPNQDALRTVAYHSLLMRGMDRHPLVRAGKAKYMYWPIRRRQPVKYGVVVYSETSETLCLSFEKAFDWRKDMRLAFDDQRPMEDIDEEVCNECLALSDVKLQKESTQ